jgi:hypothetical protein
VFDLVLSCVIIDTTTKGNKMKDTVITKVSTLVVGDKANNVAPDRNIEWTVVAIKKEEKSNRPVVITWETEKGYNLSMSYAYNKQIFKVA